MLKPKNRYAFEAFARDDLTFQMSRRQFWSALFGRWQVVRDKGRDVPVFNLADLGKWPDERLAVLAPMVSPGCEISVVDGLVCGKPPAAQQPIDLFPVESPALAAFNLFNGFTTLKEIADEIAQQTGWDADHSFAYARGLFLSLVLAGVCQPRNQVIE